MLQRFAMLLAVAAAAGTLACSQSDPGLTTAVKSKLAVDDTVKAYQIDVDTDNRIVTLKGTVGTEAEKAQAIMIARNTDGVRDVVDLIVVSPGAATASDYVKDKAGDLARDAREGAREGAEVAKELGRAVKATAGRVADEVGDVLTEAAITSGVKSSFLADSPAARIDVDTKDGVVTLNGTVGTRAEADRAVFLARESRGVKRVIDNLRVSR